MRNHSVMLGMHRCNQFNNLNNIASELWISNKLTVFGCLSNLFAEFPPIRDVGCLAWSKFERFLQGFGDGAELIIHGYCAVSMKYL
jgi:hypothetical protein